MVIMSQEVENQGILEIKDPEIDIGGIMRQIRENMATRQEIPSSAAAIGLVKMAEERKNLYRAIETLKQKIQRYGIVDTLKTGWKARLDLFAKKAIRKVIKRHIIQQEEVHESLIGAFNRLAAYLDRQEQLVRDRLDRMEEQIRLTSAGDGTGPDRGTLKFDYFGFEQKYRGPFLEIKERLRQYLPYFEGCDSLVLDIGCGRGEFVELLQETGIAIKGIDLNTEAVRFAQARKLPVEQAEAFTVLESVPDASLGGIFLGQVIEHLPPSQMISLLELGYRKLKPGAVLIAETPNPQCLVVFAESFYMDLTHVRPVHPYTLEFVFQGIGFRDVELVFSAPVNDLKFPLLEGTGIDNLEAFNHAIQGLNGLMFSHRDFAAVGRK